MTSINNFLNKTTKFAFIYITLLVFSIALISSCTKGLLDKKPLSSISDAQVWKDGALIELYINNIYRIMPFGWENPTGTIYHSFMSVSDEGTSQDDAAHAIINAGNISAADLIGNGPLNYWSRYYKIIKNCNEVLQNIDAAPIEESFRDRLKGEVTFLRAYSYFRLVALHGGVPLITKPFLITDNFNVPRNTYDECMNFVVAELDTAANLLPLEYTDANKGRVTKGAALAIKSRALLYMASPLNNTSNNPAKWQAAADAAKAVIDLNKYSLYSSYKDLFLFAAAYNSEVIWARPTNNRLELESWVERYYYPCGNYGYGQCTPLHNLVGAYETLNGKLPADDPTYDSQNPYVNRDPRFYMSILYDGAPFQGRQIETFLPGGMDSNEGPIYPWTYSRTGYYVRKFCDESISHPNATDNGNSPFIYCRYAEILLNYAEAKYFLGDEVTCRQYINMIRSRSGVNMPPVTESGTALLTRLQHEDQIEFAFEEHRYFDVRRWKIAPIVLNIPGKRMSIIKNLTTGVKTYTIVDFQPTRAFYDRNYLVPIPQHEIEKNPLLKQNPGY